MIRPSSVLNSTKYFNSLINHFSSHGDYKQVLSTFSSMLADRILPDTFSFPSLLKACASLQLFSCGLSIHQQVLVNGFSSDFYISSSLVNLYAKFGVLGYARKVFDEMREGDVVHWTAIIGCYSRAGIFGEACSLVNEMRSQGISPSPVTLLELLSGVSEITQLQCLHAFAVVYGFDSDIAAVNSLLNLYCKCDRVGDAKDLFDQMEQRDMVSWNTMVSGFAFVGDMTEILKLLYRMSDDGLRPDQQTFGASVSVSGTMCDLDMGRMLHCQIVKTGFDVEMHLRTALITMYLKCGEEEASYRVLETIPDKDFVCWTVMISGLMRLGRAEKALVMFSEMLNSGLDLSSEAIASVVASCAQLGSFDLGASVHGYILRQGYTLDTPALNSLVTMYAKCGHLDKSLVIFEQMKGRDLVSWNAIISGYAQNGDLCKALLLFEEMKFRTVQRVDSLTVVSLLQACSSSGALQVGRLIHCIVIRSFISPCSLVDTALVDMYSKCGYLEAAQRCFSLISRKDVVSWGTLIAGYGFHGKGDIALEFYSEFLRSGMEPNHVIFLAVLSSCSHNGMVQQGLKIFSSMVRDFGVEANYEHLACVVDLLCRAKRVEDAFKFYKENFMKPSIDVLGIILDACRANGITEVEDIICQDMIELKPVDAGHYVRLGQSFAAMKRWDEVSESWIQMRSLGLKKLPGWSKIEINRKTITFFMNHTSHSDETVSLLKLLSREMMQFGSKNLCDQSNNVTTGSNTWGRCQGD
ncbi:PREDICTED: pentatricopeptide repeat-containing protein At4g04370-like [Camelina sativa]|uniref:Pentatricopeptide repeat-containing protein At4g04370-like n=1 Tax=Camelina sativa TaxID=90675 RepID=A0ABM0TXH2_CAMSA|nr:PREDICTED: pentatricopeptide repeat-containing protein At4g04370-like [Camelina sativa]